MFRAYTPNNVVAGLEVEVGGLRIANTSLHKISKGCGYTCVSPPGTGETNSTVLWRSGGLGIDDIDHSSDVMRKLRKRRNPLQPSWIDNAFNPGTSTRRKHRPVRILFYPLQNWRSVWFPDRAYMHFLWPAVRTCSKISWNTSAQPASMWSTARKRRGEYARSWCVSSALQARSSIYQSINQSINQAQSTNISLKVTVAANLLAPMPPAAVHPIPASHGSPRLWCGSWRRWPSTSGLSRSSPTAKSKSKPIKGF